MVDQTKLEHICRRCIAIYMRCQLHELLELSSLEIHANRASIVDTSIGRAIYNIATWQFI